MKPTQITELFANIRTTIVSFFSILMFVALGAGIFAGISWSSNALQNAAEAAFDKGSFHNIQVVFPYGLTQENIDDIAKIEGVSKVETGRQAFATYKSKKVQKSFKVQTVGANIDKPIAVEGNLPVKEQEIALKNTTAEELGLHVGDTITFESAGEQIGMTSQLNGDSFTITALVESPEYIAASSSTYGFSPTGSVNAIAWVTPEAFNDDAYFDGYTTINVLCDGLAGMNTFSDQYKEASSEIEKRISALGDQKAAPRRDSVRMSVSDTIELGETMLALAKLARKQATMFISDGAPLHIPAGVDDALDKCVDAGIISQDLRNTAHDALNTLEGKTLTKAEKKLIRSEKKLVKQKRKELDKLIKKAEPAIAAAKEKLTLLKDYNWTVAGRSYNGGMMQASLFSNITGRLALSMAALFVIVGLLVSYSAVGRIVHEQIVQIGTKKALGLRRREITMSFLAYSALAVLAGVIIGLIVGVIVVEGIINRALAQHFTLGDYPPYFGAPLALGVTALELVLILGATWLACRHVLSLHAIELLRGEKPPEGKTRFYEKWGIWNKLPLFTQTIVNNCANDKRRVFSTIIGVAGCTALIVTAITLNDDVVGSHAAHYQNVYGFNAIATVDDSVDGAMNTVDAALQDQGATTAQVIRRSFAIVKPDGSQSLARLVVPGDSESFARVYQVNVTDGDTFDLSATDGAWVSEAYRAHLGAKVGDTIMLDGADGSVYQVPIKGFFEYYLPQYEIVMGKAAYEKVFGTSFAPTAILVDTGKRSVDEVSAALKGTPGFSSLANDKASQQKGFNQFSSISRTVVLVYLALAALMAIVVLLNLNVMFIEEKKRDLIVLMINGFSVKQAKRYIYNDTIVLTILGIVLGLVLGAAIGSITVASIEPDTAVFAKGIAWRAIAAGAAGSAILSVVMSVIALRRIPRFNLTDINKI